MPACPGQDCVLAGPAQLRMAMRLRPGWPIMAQHFGLPAVRLDVEHVAHELVGIEAPLEDLRCGGLTF